MESVQRRAAKVISCAPSAPGRAIKPACQYWWEARLTTLRRLRLRHPAPHREAATPRFPREVVRAACRSSAGRRTRNSPRGSSSRPARPVWPMQQPALVSVAASRTAELSRTLRSDCERTHHLGSPRCGRCQTAMHSQHVKPRRRHQRQEPTDERERVEHERMRSVAPSLLHVIAQSAVGKLLEPLLRQRRPGDVPTQPQQARAIPTVDRRGRVYIDPANFRTQSSAACSDARCRGMHQAQGRLPGPLARQLDACGCGLIT
jgi:hypothetical protein